MYLALDCCTLRDWRPDDAPSLVRHANDRAIWRNLRDRFPHPYTEEDASFFLHHTTVESPATSFAIVVDGAAVGGIGLVLQQDVERVGAEIGFWLGREYWNRGITTCAVRGLTGVAFDLFDLRRIYGLVFAWNAASARVFEKAGYELEGRLRKSALKDGEVTDQLLYATVR